MNTLLALFGLVLTLLTFPASAVVPVLAETREVRFGDADSEPLRTKAAALANPVAVYEFVRNGYDYITYFGSRSNSSNSFLGERGNDVDLATLLIAMLRSQGVMARYAVATVKIPASDLMSWLQVRNIDVAIDILVKQGVQQVAKSADGSSVNLEHVWVEAYANFYDYRGTTSLGCSAEPTPGCVWVGLDPSFKRYAMKAAPINVYETVPFDYTGYYNAINAADASRMNKNPLEIYQEQILAHLKSNYPGKTLADVKDNGTLVPVVAGLLPASLPYDVVGPVRRYNSVADHDAVVGVSETKKWGMQVAVTVQTETKEANGAPKYDLYGNPIPNQTLINAKRYYLSDLSTQRLTLSFGRSGQGCATPVGTVCAILRVNGQLDTASSVSASVSDIFIIKVEADGAPDQVISATYYNNIVNGYYLIGTGGETSNWSQTHRAAQRLLQVADPGGATGSGDPVLVDEVTGGLLQTAMTLYFAKFRDTIGELNALNHAVSPIAGFVGIVSSVYDVEYYDGTAFGVLPGGLLIDMKGQRLAGVWRNNVANTTAQNHYLLIGHAMSSLEHEIWQELTGFDAVSTVRGIQMALAQPGAQLVNPKNTPSNNLFTELPKFELVNSANLYTRAFKLSDIFYSYKPGTTQTWYVPLPYSPTPPPLQSWSFGALKKSVTASDPAWRKEVIRYHYYNDYNSLFDWLYCYSSHHQALYFANSSGSGPLFSSFYAQSGQTIRSTERYGIYTCGGTYIEGYPYTETNTADSLWHKERAEFLNFYEANREYLSYLDTTGSYPFVLSDFLYRNVSDDRNLQTLGVIASIRDNLATSQKLEYLIPSQRTLTDYDEFMVYIAKSYDTSGGILQSLSFQIQNWGGGFVDASAPKPIRGGHGE